jgi:hypothetical protein
LKNSKVERLSKSSPSRLRRMYASSLTLRPRIACIPLARLSANVSCAFAFRLASDEIARTLRPGVRRLTRRTLRQGRHAKRTRPPRRTGQFSPSQTRKYVAIQTIAMWNPPRSRAKSRLLPRRLRVSLAQSCNPLLLSRRSSALDNLFGKLDHGRAVEEWPRTDRRAGGRKTPKLLVVGLAVCNGREGQGQPRA